MQSFTERYSLLEDCLLNEVYLYVYSKSNPGPNQFTFKYLTSKKFNN